MRSLEHPPSFMFFTGKGDVGKTSIACPSAVQLADAGVLLVGTDPAANVGQVFSMRIGNRVTAVADVPGLSALEIDTQAAAQTCRDRIVGPVRGVLPDEGVEGLEEQLSGACKPAAALRRRRASNELRELEAARNRHASRHALVPLLAEEPVGVERLLQRSSHRNNPDNGSTRS